MALIPLSQVKYCDESANIVIFWQFCQWIWPGVTSMGLVDAFCCPSDVAHVPYQCFGTQEQQQWMALIPLSQVKYCDESANIVIFWQFCLWIWPGVTSMGLVDAFCCPSDVAHVP